MTSLSSLCTNSNNLHSAMFAEMAFSVDNCALAITSIVDNVETESYIRCNVALLTDTSKVSR